MSAASARTLASQESTSRPVAVTDIGATRIHMAIAEIDSGAKLEFDLDARQVDIEAKVDTTAILAALKDAGYEASPAS